MRSFSADHLQDPILRKHINTFDREIKRRWKIDDKASVQKAAPTFPAFYPNLVPRENDKDLGPMPDGPPNPDSFTPE